MKLCKINNKIKSFKKLQKMIQFHLMIKNKLNKFKKSKIKVFKMILMKKLIFKINLPPQLNKIQSIFNN